MNVNVDINEVKKYNTLLKQYKEVASRTQAEKDFLLAELNTACKELSAELGTEVTRENIDEVANSICNKINNALESGNAVLSKIASETSQSAQVTQQTTYGLNSKSEDIVQSAPVAPVSPVTAEKSSIQFNGEPVIGNNGASKLPSFFNI